jgi:hypothetical protein
MEEYFRREAQLSGELMKDELTFFRKMLREARGESSIEPNRLSHTREQTIFFFKQDNSTKSS